MRALDAILHARGRSEGSSVSPLARGRGEGEGLPRALLVVAVDAEANALRRALALPEATHAPWRPVELTDRLDLVVCGVGKSNAAGAAARALTPDRHGCVLSLGIAGALPADRTLAPGDLILATRSVLADEGMLTPAGFQSLAQMGFPPLPDSPDGMSVEADPRLLGTLAPLVNVAAPVATVSVCSANDALAHDVARRTGALAEAMEGAAIGTVARALALPFAEVRAISNTTGDRDRQRWDIRAALGALERLASSL